jgi:hypothetical protein
VGGRICADVRYTRGPGLAIDSGNVSQITEKSLDPSHLLRSNVSSYSLLVVLSDPEVQLYDGQRVVDIRHPQEAS